ncbi:hypothetical protein [Komagataeibacter rhaeticus]|uniref:hypothetical protein n=1 Tax=Komagataeibacter rhaeticus TaxID=215221 RepID=UPI001CD37629|nr:hypothetical protein [Komagataeibacter rhaeticus]
MRILAAGSATAIDRLSMLGQVADEDDTLPTPGQSAATESGHTETLPVSVTLSQAAIASLNGATPQSRQVSTQLALSRLDQIIRSGNSAAKADAGTRVENLKAQMRQLMEMKAFMSPKALAAALAQMAHELAAAVSEYVQCGGSAANAAIGTVVLSTPADASDGPATAQSSTDAPAAAPDQNGTAIQQTGQQTQEENTITNSDIAKEQMVAGEKTRTPANDDDLFKKDVQSLAEQMKEILHEVRNKDRKRSSSENSDLQATQSALDTVDQLMPKI